MTKRSLSISSIFLLAGIFLFINGMSHSLFRRVTLDLTEEGLYSLSDGTKNILTSVTEPITLRFYFSKVESARYPGVKLYGERVLSLLREFEATGGKQIVLEVYDPRPDSEEEEWADRYGLRFIPTGTGEKLYFGLVATSSLGEEQVIPVFDMTRQQTLEYDITKVIYSLVVAKKPVVGILTSLDVRGEKNVSKQPNPFTQNRPTPWFFRRQLEELTEVRDIAIDTDTIEDEVDVLLVLHPKDLSDPTLYAIDQFVLRGGKLLALVDPYCSADNPTPDPNNPMGSAFGERNSDLDKLLSTWGVSLVRGKVVGDINLAAQVNTGRGGPPQMFIPFLSLSSSNMAAEDVTVGELENVLVPWSGVLAVSEVEGVVVTPLLKTTPEAMLLDVNDVRFGGGEPTELLRKYEKGAEEQVLAVRISGKLKTNFPGGFPGSEPEEEIDGFTSANQHLEESGGVSNVVVIADADFLTDRFSVSLQNVFGFQLHSFLNDNFTLLQNVIENLSGSDDLISIRSRGRFSRPFTKVAELESNAQERWKQEESQLQAQLDAVTKRLNELQSAAGGPGGNNQAFSQAMLGELEKFREDRRLAQKKLREVRRNLRQDKEQLGQILFFVNTFLVPLLLVAGSVTYFRIRIKARQRRNK